VTQEKPGAATGSGTTPEKATLVGDEVVNAPVRDTGVHSTNVASRTKDLTHNRDGSIDVFIGATDQGTKGERAGFHLWLTRWHRCIAARRYDCAP